jgi:hypothetical protein
VSALINEDTRWWDSIVLDSMFSKEEVSIIQSIPASMSNKEDRCIWRGTKNGHFTIRSADHLQQEINIQNEASSSSMEGYSEVWSKIWSLQLPGVENVFYGKLAKKFYPHGPTFSRRKMWTTCFTQHEAVNPNQYFISFGHVIRQGMLGL